MPDWQLVFGIAEDAQIEPITCEFYPWWYTPLTYMMVGISVLTVVLVVMWLFREPQKSSD